MIEKFAKLVPQEIVHRSGLTFYSGRTAYSKPSDIYLMGYNPGGDAHKMNKETIELENKKMLEEYPDRFSSYQDASWDGKKPGTVRMQPRILHMLIELGYDPQEVPSSNLIFVRPNNVHGMKNEAKILEEKCWPFHKAVISALQIRVIICLGKDTGSIVGDRIGAYKKVGSFIEQNNRGWKSEAFKNKNDQIVIHVTHPSRADWTNPKADPTPLVQAMLDRKYGYSNC